MKLVKIDKYHSHLISYISIKLFFFTLSRSSFMFHLTCLTGERMDINLIGLLDSMNAPKDEKGKKNLSEIIREFFRFFFSLSLEKNVLLIRIESQTTNIGRLSCFHIYLECFIGQQLIRWFMFI